MRLFKNILIVIIAGIIVAGIVKADLGTYWKTINSLIPRTDNSVDIGSASNTIRAVYTNDLLFNGEIQPDGSTCSNGEILKKTAANDWDCSADAGGNYTASGTLLQLVGTDFSLKEGTLTNGKGCSYLSASGLNCNSDFLTSAITSLQGLTSSVQTVATSTASNLFDWSSSGSVHTLTIPSNVGFFDNDAGYLTAENDPLSWLLATAQTGITGDKSGSFDFTTTGKGTFGASGSDAVQVVENSHLRIGGTSIYPTNSKIKIGDGDFVTISEPMGGVLKLYGDRGIILDTVNSSYRISTNNRDVVDVLNLGVGTSTPSQAIDIEKNNPMIRIKETSAASSYTLNGLWLEQPGAFATSSVAWNLGIYNNDFYFASSEGPGSGLTSFAVTSGYELGDFGIFDVLSTTFIAERGFIANNIGGDFDSIIKSKTYDNMFVIDGGLDQVEIGNSATGTIATFDNTGVVFNGNLSDRDFIVKSDTNANMLNVNGGNNNVGIGKVPTAGIELDVSGDIGATNSILSSGMTMGIGYTTGSGASTTQATSKTTGVTLNAINGQITATGTALASLVKATFTVSDSAVVATDNIILTHQSGGTEAAYATWIESVSAGSFEITIYNTSGGSLSESLILNFAVIKSTAQ